VSEVLFDVTHTTEYDYSELVSVSHHLARLKPRTLAHQRCEEHRLTIDPPPAVMSTYDDYFGNTTTFFAVQKPHRRLLVRGASRVVLAGHAIPRPCDTPAWESATGAGTLPFETVEFAVDGRDAATIRQLDTYTRESFPAGRPILEAVAELTHRIFSEFTFDPRATTVATPLMDVFTRRRGVCQDFARLEIACLRALGLPARYLSGYLETVPPPGRPRLVGADASHAWLEVYCPEVGWVPVDPTNDLLPASSHIALAWGRDYSDVSPIRGVILGGGAHELSVHVDVVRLDGGAHAG
jgi:transglutaminase-like putative cysteine protease